MNLEILRKIANASTRERRRAEAMGFTFTGVDVMPFVDDTLVVKADFTCVCGRAERAQFAFYAERMHPEVLKLELDIAARIRAFGSFSEKHLREDGYTENQIADILRRGEQFDRDNPQ